MTMPNPCQTCGKEKCRRMELCTEVSSFCGTRRENYCHAHPPTEAKCDGSGEIQVECGLLNGSSELRPRNCAGCTSCLPAKDEDVREGWEDKFDQRVNEILTADEYTEEPVEFGFRKVLRDSHGNDNLVTATDWGNVKNFIRTLVSSLESKHRMELENRHCRGCSGIDKPGTFNASFDRVAEGQDNPPTQNA